MSTVTAKIQIYVPNELANALFNTTEAYRQACNWLSSKVFTSHEFNQLKLNALYYRELRSLFGLKSQMAQSVMKTVAQDISRLSPISIHGRLSNLNSLHSILSGIEIILCKGIFSPSIR